MSVVTDNTFDKSQKGTGPDSSLIGGALVAKQGEGHMSNASTPLTRGSSLTNTQTKFRELDALINRQQATIDAHAKQSTERLSMIEQHFKRFDELNQKIDQVSDQVIQSTASNKTMVLSLRSDIEAQTRNLQKQNSAYQNHCDNQTDKLGQTVLRAMEEIALMRSDISKLTNFMMKDITNRSSPSAEPKRRKQRTKRTIFDDLMPGVLLHDTSIPEDMSMTQDQYDDDDFSDESSPNLAMQLDAVFQTHDNNDDVRLAATSPLPSSPTQQPLATTQSETYASEALPHQANPDNTAPLPSWNSKIQEATSQTTTPPVLTKLSNTQRAQNSIQRYFSSAPLNPRNNKTTDSAGAKEI